VLLKIQKSKYVFENANDACIFFSTQNIKTAEEIWKIDQIKVETAILQGYEVMIVWENDFLQNKEGVLNECYEFIKK